MNHTKDQFIAIWIIYGFAVLFAVQQYILFLKEILVLGGIYFDVSPAILKYSQTMCYGIAWIIILTMLIRIIRTRGPVFTDVNYRKARLMLVVFVVTGIIAQVATDYVVKLRRAGFREYLNRHDSSMIEFLTQYHFVTVIPVIMIFITVMTGFFILTRKDNNLKNEGDL